MTDHKFTDDDVIKALEYSVEYNERKNASCDGCPLEKVFPYCNRECSEDTLDVMYLALINRQKAEIESLNAIHADAIESLRLAAEANKDMQAELKSLKHRYDLAVTEREANVKGFAETLKTIKAEAIKEFAERLIDKCTDPHWCVWMNEIEDLVTEMTENKR